MDNLDSWQIGQELSRDAVMGVVYAVAQLHRKGETAFGCLIDGSLQGVYASEREAQTRMDMAVMEKRMEQVTGMDCMG